jgi:hypothetical protein
MVSDRRRDVKVRGRMHLFSNNLPDGKSETCVRFQEIWFFPNLRILTVRTPLGALLFFPDPRRTARECWTARAQLDQHAVRGAR